MKGLLRLVPLVSLALVLVVLGLAWGFDRPIRFPFTEPPEGSSLPEVDLDLGERTLAGVVVDSDGVGVEGAGLTTYQSGRPVWTWTGEGGSFELTELAPGDLRLLVVALGFEATPFAVSVPGRRRGAPESVVASESQEPVRLVLERRIAEPPSPGGLDMSPVTGNVEFAPGADPSGADGHYEVLLMPTTAPSDPAGGFPARAAVAPDGGFTLDIVHAGRYRVILLAPDDRGAAGPDLLQGADGAPLLYEHVTAGDVPELDLRSTAGGVRGRVHGTALDRAGDRNVPIRGALVRVEPAAPIEDSPDLDAEGTDGSAEPGTPGGLRASAFEGSYFRATRTDDTGRFELNDLPAGRYALTVVAGLLRVERTVEIPARTLVEVDVIDR